MFHRKIGRHEAANKCRHRRNTVATNSGLQLVICRSCKHVSVRYLHPVIVDDIFIPGEQLPA